jgi:hypothetical protein
MKARSLARLLLMSLIALFAAASTSPVLAAPPTTEQVTDVFDVPESACGFPIEGTFEATIKTSTFVDKNGNVVKTIERFLHATLTFINVETGASLTGKSAGPLITRGDTQTATGINARFVVPGQGIVAAQVGRLVFVGDELVLERGQNDELFPTLCSVLADMQ